MRANLTKVFSRPYQKPMKTPRNFWLLMAALLLAPILADAQNQSSVRLLAESEVLKPAGQPASKAKHSTGALSADQSASILRLSDEYQPPKARNFQWTFGFAASQHQTKGNVNIPGVANQNLNEAKKSTMPAVSVGSLYTFKNNTFGTWQVGLEGAFGLTSQNTSVQTVGPLVDARLNSSFVDAHTLLRWGPAQSSRWHLAAGLGYGRYTVNQTSNESLVRWSKSADYRSTLAAVDFQVSEDWVIEARNRWQSPIGNSNPELLIPNSTLELGAKVIW
jgi:hypothetical protein